MEEGKVLSLGFHIHVLRGKLSPSSITIHHLYTVREMLRPSAANQDLRR